MPKMRRSDRAATPEKAWEILENAEFMTLSMMGAEGAPYGVTLSFARVGESLYFHCANEGYKLDSLRKNPAVCVGTAREVTEQAERVEGLLAICKKYAPEAPGAAEYVARYPEVSVWRVDVTAISGKIHD